MPVNSTPARLMAPWFRDLVAAEKNGVVDKREVDRKIAPWAEQITVGSSYEKAIEDLLTGARPGVRLTSGGKTALQVLAAQHGTQHFSPGVSNLGWSYGPGIQPPAGFPTGPAINMDVVFSYADVKPKYKVRTDEKTRTITVLLEGTSTNAVHPLIAVHPQPLRIAMQRPKQLGKEYKIVVRDANSEGTTYNKVLAQTKFGNFLPA